MTRPADYLADAREALADAQEKLEGWTPGPAEVARADQVRAAGEDAADMVRAVEEFSNQVGNRMVRIEGTTSERHIAWTAAAIQQGKDRGAFSCVHAFKPGVVTLALMSIAVAVCGECAEVITPELVDTREGQWAWSCDVCGEQTEEFFEVALQTGIGVLFIGNHCEECRDFLRGDE